MEKERSKTPYRQLLEGLENQLQSINSTTTRGQKCLFYALICDVKDAHRYFSEILEKIKSKKCHTELLNYDSDVDYLDWGGANRLKLNVTEASLTVSTPKPLIIPSEISRSMNKALDGFTIGQIIQILQENIRLLKDVLIQIDLAIKDSHPNGEEMFHCLQAEFDKEHGAQVDHEFGEWEDSFDSDEVMKTHLKGKEMRETVRMMRSGVLDVKMPHMNDVDTGCYRSEIDRMQTKLIPEGMDFETFYAAFRELADVVNGEILPHFSRVGDFLYRHRKLVDTEQRDSLFYYFRVMKCIGEAAKVKVTELEELNYAAPAIWLKQKYLPACAPWLKEGFDLQLLKDYADELMGSEMRNELALEWQTKKYKLVAKVIASLIEAGVLMDEVTELIKAIMERDDLCDIKLRTITKYVSDGRKSELADWSYTYFTDKIKD